MRDFLTIVAGLVILVLAAALALPPLVNWDVHRGWIESGLSRAFGQEVRTDGPISLRLLPTPRLRARRVRIGTAGSPTGNADAMYLRAEIALTPLLSGEVRLLDARIGRAEIKLPVGTGGSWRVPARLLAGAQRRKGWALEDMRVAQFLLTTTDPETGRTDQHYAEEVRMQAASPLGPWRFEGRQNGTPIEVSLGELVDRKAQIRFGFGKTGTTRLDFDGQLALLPIAGDLLQPRVTGTAKLSAALPDLPVQAQANVSAAEGAAELTDLAIEAGEGTATTRLTGEGRYLLRDPALFLKLSGRRLDPALPKRAFALAKGRGRLPFPVDLTLALDSLPLGADDEISHLSLSLLANGGMAQLRSLEMSGPGRSTVQANGSLWLGAAPGAQGQVKVEAQDGQRLLQSLEAQGIQGFAGFLEPGPLDASAEVSIFAPVISLRDLRLAQGDLRLSGVIRHTEAEDGARPRLDAQLAVQGLDISALGRTSRLFSLARDHDLGLSIDARDVVHGGHTGGRISGRIVTEGPAIVVDALEVENVAGAQASLSGRIAPDGTGRIEGRLNAPRAAPLLDLFGEAWIGQLASLVPAAMRDDPVELRVEVEESRDAEPSIPAIRTRLRGRFGGAPFEADTSRSGGVLAAFTLKADPAAAIGLAPTPGDAPRFTLDGKREADGRLAATVSGEIGGLKVRTVAPLLLGPDGARASGEVAVEGADAAPLLARFGVATPGPVPVAVTLALGAKERPAYAITGEVGGTRLSAELSGTSPRAIAGSVTLERLSLPWLAGVLALGPPPAAGQGIWPTGRFAPPPVLPVAGTVAVKTSRLDLGFGIQAGEAAFSLTTQEGGMKMTGIDAKLGEARLRGNLNLDRQGGLAAVRADALIEGLPAKTLIGGPFAAGRITAKLQLGGSGESPAAIVANLGGAGDVTTEGLSIEASDPAAPARLAARALKSDEPLAGRNFEPAISEELGRGPLAASTTVAAPGALVAGALRLSPLRIEATTGTWQGTALLDLRGLALDIRGALQSREPPPHWSGAPPTLGLGWAGSFGKVTRSLDSAPLVNGLATNVLSRELERIDTFEQDEAERRRRRGREEMERQRSAPASPPSPPGGG